VLLPGSSVSRIIAYPPIYLLSPRLSLFALLVAREKPRARTLDHAHRLEVALLHTRAAFKIADVGLTASVIAANCTVCQWIREGSRSGR
jgi:hypothetical protein